MRSSLSGSQCTASKNLVGTGVKFRHNQTLCTDNRQTEPEEKEAVGMELSSIIPVPETDSSLGGSPPSPQLLSLMEVTQTAMTDEGGQAVGSPPQAQGSYSAAVQSLVSQGLGRIVRPSSTAQAPGTNSLSLISGMEVRRIKTPSPIRAPSPATEPPKELRVNLCRIAEPVGPPNRTIDTRVWATPRTLGLIEKWTRHQPQGFSFCRCCGF